MDTIKKFIKYFLLFIALYVFVSFFSGMYIAGDYKDLERIEILINTPEVNITEAKATYVNGVIKGNITNNTGEYLQNTYVKIDCYSDTEHFIDSVYVDVLDLGTNETREFEKTFAMRDINSIKISVVETAPLEDDGFKISEDLLGIGLIGLLIILIV